MLSKDNTFIFFLLFLNNLDNEFKVYIKMVFLVFNAIRASKVFWEDLCDF
jgi:hypothetical protein